jgi:hypothetical protein
LEEELYESFIQNLRESEGRDGLGFTLDTRHSNTNFTLAVRYARVHVIPTPAGDDRGSAGELLKTDHKKVRELFKKAEKTF